MSEMERMTVRRPGLRREAHPSPAENGRQLSERQRDCGRWSDWDYLRAA